MSLLKFKIFCTIILVNTTLLSAVEMPPAPPKLVTGKKLHIEKKESTLPPSCQMIPPMIIKLPPPMEIQLSKCKNELYIPSIVLAEKKLSAYFKRKVTVEKVEIVENFVKLYKITYDKGTILSNTSVDALIAPNYGIIHE